MVDRLTPEQRSDLMRKVKGKTRLPKWSCVASPTAPGSAIAFTAKTCRASLDLCFPARRKVIFVHGCFWHGHDCKLARLPKSRPEYWLPKIVGNRKRDAVAAATLAALGWKVLTVWECETKNREALRDRIEEFLRAQPVAQRSAP